jgi:CBS domain-containing protein
MLPPVLAKTVQAAGIWLNELCGALELYRTLAWKVLSTGFPRLGTSCRCSWRLIRGPVLPLMNCVVQNDQFESAPEYVNQKQENPMQVQDLMTRDVATVSPDQTVQQAARLMAELDVGALPVGENDRLVGMITDRDIAVRGLADGKGPNTKVRRVMTPDIKYCFIDDEIDEITANMAEIQVRRLPVVNRDKRLVGILSLSDIAVSNDPDQAIEALSGISRPTNRGWRAQMA